MDSHTSLVNIMLAYNLFIYFIYANHPSVKSNPVFCISLSILKKLANFYKQYDLL